jgi:hypothetical protein
MIFFHKRGIKPFLLNERTIGLSLGDSFVLKYHILQSQMTERRINNDIKRNSSLKFK